MFKKQEILQEIIMKLIYPTVLPLFLINLIEAQDQVAEADQPEPGQGSCYYALDFGYEDWGYDIKPHPLNCEDRNEYCHLDLESAQIDYAKSGVCKTCDIRNDFYMDTLDGLTTEERQNLQQKYVDKKLSKVKDAEESSEETTTLDLDDIKLPACPLTIKTFDGYQECCSKCLYTHCDARAWHIENNIDPFQGKTKCEKKKLEAEFNNIDVNYANWIRYPLDEQLKIQNSFTVPPLCDDIDGSFQELQFNQRNNIRDPTGVDGEPYCADTETGEKVSGIYYDRTKYARCIGDDKYEDHLEWEESNGGSSLVWSLTAGVVIGINWMV